jgi:hypothetical protein
VLICGVIFGYGGLENHFLDLGKLLVENDAEVTFATRVANQDVTQDARVARGAGQGC